MRRAALTLHALSPQDRAWVLGRLEPQQQRALEEQLQDLEGLGIAADARLVTEALGDETAQSATRARRMALAAHSAQAVRAALQDEPAALIARVLDQGPWPWEVDFLAGLDAQRRVRISACRGSAPGGSELDEWLLGKLAERLGTPHSAAPAPSRTGALRQWLARLKGAAR
jgi:hypothetical protein